MCRFGRGKSFTILLYFMFVVSSGGALPTFSSSSYTTSVSELTHNGSILINITASPANPANTLVYNIFNHPASLFTIDPATGSVILIGQLDYEQETSHSFNVEVYENSNVAMTPVTIEVINVNDEVPLCSQSIYALTLLENTAIGDDILSLTCSDSDGDTLTYSLGGDSAHMFRFDASSLTLSLVASLQSYSLSTLLFSISVTDDLHTLELSVYVYVEPSNEHVPRFNQNTYDCSITESATIGTVFCVVLANDDDRGRGGDITYKITGGDDANTFGINKFTGEIVLVGHIDYESTQGYLLFVQATDNGLPPLSNTIQVRISITDVNDNAPSINALILGSIEENSPIGSVVLELECSDADSELSGTTLLSLPSQYDDSGRNASTFSINSSDELITDLNIDYETGLYYTILITCIDSGSPPLSSSSTVIVSITPTNEFAPLLESDDYRASLNENLTVGTSVIQMSATDRDMGSDGSIEFSIESIGRDFLQISRLSGLVTTTQLLNCDWGVEHVFTITAMDEGTPPLSSQSQLRIEFIHCNLGQLVPAQNLYFANVTENSPKNTEVTSVHCDFNREVTGEPQYSIFHPQTSPFNVDTSSGVLSVAVPPDYETLTSEILQLQCTDPSSSNSASTFFVFITILPVNEHSPEFSLILYETQVSEDSLPGTSILTVQAMDKDSGSDASVVYSIVDDEDTESFAVDPQTGTIYLSIFLDREVKSQNSFEVVAVDKVGEGDTLKSAVVQVQVGVTDINDNSPRCDRVVYFVTVSPLLETGESVLSLSCTDADIGLNSQLHYSLSYQLQISDYFAVIKETGELVLAQQFTSQSPSVYEMTVTVSDGGEPSRSTAVLVVVNLETSPVTIAGEESLVASEASLNSVDFTLEDMSLGLWEESGGRESFKEAVAHSITTHCSILPDSCSLLSICTSSNNRRRRSVDEDFDETRFTAENVVIHPKSTNEFSGADGLLYLNLTFYIILPDGAQRTAPRSTDYVIPRTTLSLLLRNDGGRIESQVRGEITPPLTQGTTEDILWDPLPWAMMGVFAALFTGLCIIMTLLGILIKKWKSSKKLGVSISPAIEIQHKIKNSPSTRQSMSGMDASEGNTKKKKRLLELRDLMHLPSIIHNEESSSREESKFVATTDIADDDVSTIQLIEEEEEEELRNSSLRGQPGSSRGSGSAISRETDQSSPPSASSVRGDYKQNFPFEPPRQQLRTKKLKPLK